MKPKERIREILRISFLHPIGEQLDGCIHAILVPQFAHPSEDEISAQMIGMALRLVIDETDFLVHAIGQRQRVSFDQILPFPALVTLQDEIEPVEKRLPRYVILLVPQIRGPVESDLVIHVAGPCQIQQIVDDLSPIRHVYRSVVGFVQRVDQLRPRINVVIHPVVAALLNVHHEPLARIRMAKCSRLAVQPNVGPSCLEICLGSGGHSDRYVEIVDYFLRVETFLK